MLHNFSLLCAARHIISHSLPFTERVVNCIMSSLRAGVGLSLIKVLFLLVLRGNRMRSLEHTPRYSVLQPFSDRNLRIPQLISVPERWKAENHSTS